MKLKLKLLEQQLQHKEPKGKKLVEFRKNLYNIAMDHNLSLLERKLAAEFVLNHAEIVGVKLTKQVLSSLINRLSINTIKGL